MRTGNLNPGYFISVVDGKAIFRHQVPLSLIWALIIPDTHTRYPQYDIRAGAGGGIP
jgi:hypothetical protein